MSIREKNDKEFIKIEIKKKIKTK